MTRRTWVRLDNTSNIFLAARTDTDPKVFRVGAELDHVVDPATLQRALDATYDRYPLYHAVLRSGVFWYYLQDSDLRPLVSAEDQHTCAPLYVADRRTLLFRVVHHGPRVSLEVFHALTDGTGALWFLVDLLAAYVGLRAEGRVAGQDAGEAPDAARGLTGDSFAHYFRGRDPEDGATEADPAGAAFVRAASTAPVAEAPPVPRAERHRERPSRVHRVRGTRTPDHRTRVVELTVPAPEVIALAKAEGVAVTVYLTALLFEAVRRSAPRLAPTRTLGASLPVNLRQFFPSTSARNFFATVRLEHTYGNDDQEVLGEVCRDLDAQFRRAATPEALEDKLRGFIRLERAPLLRVVPRPLKDVLLGLVNASSNRGLTVAVSNLGRVALPEEVAAHVGRMQFHVSAARPQLSVLSHAGLLTLSFTSPFVETAHVEEVARFLTARGVEVRVAAGRVTEAELAEGEPVEVGR
ncbi:hypothetical protein SAMN04488544_0124 [Microlunatus sagamiharensis]|uniref:Alcohol acetyltransferase n=1 Tax=Microlunatus sagamiharensis TaxID=546874 RepID=A0A1H2LGH0_9ACTN|nr:alcohol acetyltransferase [Microlunatus sagamiharensis]SDU80143.1 hypothetical protein SAMN04488544_0124 [Microlunatus sagamiharensis]